MLPIVHLPGRPLYVVLIVASPLVLGEGVSAWLPSLLFPLIFLLPLLVNRADPAVLLRTLAHLGSFASLLQDDGVVLVAGYGTVQTVLPA